MRKAPAITCLFLDIGGVLLTDGWDHHARRRAALAFKLDRAELEARHRPLFEIYEEGKLTLEEYLSEVIFHQKRSFTRAAFRRFMFAQSRPHPDMIDLVTQLRASHGLRVLVVSNEGRELNAHRVQAFRLDRLADSFLSSSFVHLRKPDPDMFRLALDLAQTPARQIIYLDDTRQFIRMAAELGIPGIVHTGVGSTRAQLAALGLSTATSLPPSSRPH